jgi:2-polyprenyl-3-methyl-5-hydroxy-6-metoxy-1,4-benzoquinol methylase
VDVLPDVAELRGRYDEAYVANRAHSEGVETIAAAKEATFARFLNSFGISPDGSQRLLEVGCSTGLALQLAAQRGRQISGLDVNEHAVEVAKQRLPSADIRVGAIEEADWPAQHFDAIAMFDVIEHLERPDTALKQLAELLRVGGRLLIVTPNAASLSARLMRRRWPHLLRDHLHVLTPHAITNLIRDAGLRLESLGSAPKHITLEMVRRHATEHTDVLGASLLRRILGLLPMGLRARSFAFNLGEMIAVAERPSDRRGVDIASGIVEGC